MKMKLFAGAALLAMGAIAAHAQPGTYTPGDLLVTFENTSGNDVELNLGLVTSLPTAGTLDFGNVSSLGVTSDPWSVIADVDANALKGGATQIVNTGLGALTVLPQTLVYTQNNSSTPSFVGSASAQSSPVKTAFDSVGTDIATNTVSPATYATPVTLTSPSSVTYYGISTVAGADTIDYTNKVPFAGIGSALETTGTGSSALWLLTSQIPGTSGKSGVNEGPFTGAYDIGTFNLSSSGELTFTAIPEPSTYAAILGALTIGIVAIRRRRLAVA
jgi:hypothetical protein